MSESVDLISQAHGWLPVVFVALMGVAVLAYAILDGYDLGVGILLPINGHQEADRDTMIASIGPFWDANETWLVLAVGLLLIAFPLAHSLVLFHLYIPATVMLIGLIMRGVAFDFRAKAAIDHKLAWDRVFKLGSIITALSQGYMLGQYVTGFEQSLPSVVFSIVSALGVLVAYSYIGAAWLVMKTEYQLQKQAIEWARFLGRLTFAGVVTVCVVNLWVNPDVFSRWFEFPLVMFVLLIPFLCLLAFLFVDITLERVKNQTSQNHMLPFLLVVAIFVMCFSGLAFSFFPYVVPGKLTIWETSSSPESLMFIFVGAVVVIPCILAYTIFSYRVFSGKATDLEYY